MSAKTGALVLGGNLNGLTIARSLGRRGVPVWVVTTLDAQLAKYSRYAERTFVWPAQDPESQIAYLSELAEKFHLDDWVVFPTSDDSAALLSKFRSALSRRLRVSTPEWKALRWAFDKRLSYQLAAEQGVDYPSTIYPVSSEDPKLLECKFPAILKPATHSVACQLTVEKAWPVSNHEELIRRYRDARELIPADLILVQEKIPGGGEAQFSYAALCRDGEPIASLTARRTRQYPIDFGYSSSFVETRDVPEIVAPSRRLLAAIKYTGLVELEYKFDSGDGLYKLLDINPRIWTWSALGARAGVDFPYLLWQMIAGERVQKCSARLGVRWMRVSTDVPAALHLLFRGRLTFKSYLRSLRGPIQFALMAKDDPLPGLMDLPIFAFKHFYKCWKAVRNLFPQREEKKSSGPNLQSKKNPMQSLAASAASTPATELKAK